MAQTCQWIIAAMPTTKAQYICGISKQNIIDRFAVLLNKETKNVGLMNFLPFLLSLKFLDFEKQ
jgi:hypothetical protein